MAQDGVADGGGIAGIEHGTYVWAPEVRGCVLNAAPGVDTNGHWGLWPRPTMNMRVSADLRTVTFAESLRTISATRVGAQPQRLPPNYQGLWWNSPAGSESGWGINFAHQGDLIFATWFTYDVGGKPRWLIARLDKRAGGIYAGAVSTVAGPPFNSVPFPPGGSPVGRDQPDGTTRPAATASAGSYGSGGLALSRGNCRVGG